MIRAIIAALICALPVSAQEFPSLYSVTGVASDDALNIRRTPTARSDVIGTFAPDQTSIEVTGTDATGRWALVNSGEMAGWTALRFLAREPGAWHDMVSPLSCFGTEPFWSARLTPRAPSVFEAAGKPGIGMVPEFEERPFTAIKSVVMRHTIAGGDATTIIRGEACNDGMSDREFGLSVILVMTRDDAMQVWSGCCSLAD